MTKTTNDGGLGKITRRLQRQEAVFGRHEFLWDSTESLEASIPNKRNESACYRKVHTGVNVDTNRVTRLLSTFRHFRYISYNSEYHAIQV